MILLYNVYSVSMTSGIYSQFVWVVDDIKVYPPTIREKTFILYTSQLKFKVNHAKFFDENTFFIIGSQQFRNSRLSGFMKLVDGTDASTYGTETIVSTYSTWTDQAMAHVTLTANHNRQEYSFGEV